MLNYYISLLFLKEAVSFNTPLQIIQKLLKEKFGKEVTVKDIQASLLEIEVDLIQEPEIQFIPDDYFEGY